VLRKKPTEIAMCSTCGSMSS